VFGEEYGGRITDAILVQDTWQLRQINQKRNTVLTKWKKAKFRESKSEV
jgi:hypothetical protein